MRGSLWKCTAIHCKLAADDEARGLEVQNALLADLRTELIDGRGRKSYVDVTREKTPPSEASGSGQVSPPEAAQAPTASEAPTPEPEVEVERDLPSIAEEEPFLPDEDERLRTCSYE